MQTSFKFYFPRTNSRNLKRVRAQRRKVALDCHLLHWATLILTVTVISQLERHTMDRMATAPFMFTMALKTVRCQSTRKLSTLKTSWERNICPHSASRSRAESIWMEISILTWLSVPTIRTALLSSSEFN